MRLLNTKTLRVQEFLTEIPLYAILSHTWEAEEVTFQDIQNIATLAATCNERPVTFDDVKAFLPTAQLKKGYTKVVQACVRARNSAFDWIWIDSCCINKESSAELSEAINSMYQYYEDAVVCYVYLFDVSGTFHPKNPESNFKKSKWFTRGWTLQELLAPRHISFFDKDWTKIGTRWSLRDLISVVTTIPIDVFEERNPTAWESFGIDKYSVAQKMSWAADRQTTRPEDKAYCLMGIFGVSMSPIYGEGGEKAFMRLQQEIIRVSDDRSIFAWVCEEGRGWFERGLLARSPSEFRYSGRVWASNTGSTLGNSPSSYSFNNNGLHIHLPLKPCDSKDLEDPYDSGSGADTPIFLAYLHCQTNDGSSISVYLRRTTDGYYVRKSPSTVVLQPAPPPLDDVRELTVREKPTFRWSRFRLPGAGKNVVSLLPSAQHFVCSRPPPASISTEFSVEFETDADRTNLTYKFPSKSEAFTLAFLVNDRDWWLDIKWDYSLQIGYKRVDFIDNMQSAADYMLGPLPNSCFVSVCLEMRGDEKKVFEVDYFSPEDSRSEGVATTVGPDLDLWVPSEFKLYVEEKGQIWERFRCVPVPHSDFLVFKYINQERLSSNSDSDSETDLDLDSETDLDSDSETDSEMERRDKRKGRGIEQGGPPTFYVAVGSHQSLPWTHITFNGKSTDDVRADIQSMKEDLYGQTSGTATINHSKLRVQIGPATELNQATHQLRFDWVEDEDDAVDEKKIREGTGDFVLIGSRMRTMQWMRRR
ncbi:hypothetical protein D9758_012648 [Tetrapyrgos nigripes]|uniref:Heterokaryon incompatibility domain-containing protein n=1 Tax=Tetrapyrgos nigripes TaxID=182062 RepID=A0A8H5GDH9_9AGAR|nr:hypothetical protein D9758_012648 [Tetrapyrgos nigripes]